MDLGANPASANREGITVLNFIAKRGQIEMAEACYEAIGSKSQKLDFVNSSNANGWTVLMSAANAGSKEMVDWLLEKGAQVKAKMNTG